MKRNKFGVVVVTCNRLNLLKECIQAIEEQSTPFEKIVIVNNASTDGTEEYLKHLDSISKFDIIHSKENLGGAGGFASALERILNYQLEWVLIIDDDAILHNDFVERIDNAIRKWGNQYQAFSGVVLEDGEPSIFHRKLKTDRDVIGHAISIEEYNNPEFICDIASFCGLIINHELIRKIGLPKREYFIWHDDTEYCLRMNNITRILNVNSAKLEHKRKPGASDIHDWKNYYGLRNSLDIFRKYSKKQFYKEMMKISFRCLKAYKDKDTILVEIYKSVLRDALRKKLGMNYKFLPGKAKKT